MKGSTKIKVIFIVALVLIGHILFDRRLNEETICFLLKLCLYIFIGAILLWVITFVAKEIFIKVVRNEETEDEGRE